MGYSAPEKHYIRNRSEATFSEGRVARCAILTWLSKCITVVSFMS